MINRLLKYLLLVVVTIVTPYLTTIILITVTGDRIEGMKLGIISGLILPHLIFGLAFIQRQLMTKILLTILVTAAIYGLLFLKIPQGIWSLTDTDGHGFIYTNFDAYGFWDLVLTNLIFGLIAWETFYHADKLMTKRRVTLK